MAIITIVRFFAEKAKDANEHKKEIAAKISDSIKDVRADERVANSSTRIIKDIGEAIGKYSLGYDSSKKEIAELKQLIKDSANRKTTVIQGNSPNVLLCLNDGLKLNFNRNDTIEFHIDICCESAPAIVKKAHVYLMASEFISESDVLSN